MRRMSERSLRRAQQRRIAALQRRETVLRRRFGMAATAALGASAILASSAQATTYQVTSGLDGPADPSCTDPCTLRDRIAQANAPGNDTITFASSVTGTITLNQGELATPTGAGDLTIVGPGADKLTVSAENASRVFDIGSSASAFAVSGLTVTNGTAPGLNPNGGAILSTGPLTLTDVVVSNSTAPGDGGGVFVGGGLTMVASKITGNTSGGSGGGVRQPTARGGSGKYVSTDMAVEDSVVSGNVAVRGGGISRNSRTPKYGVNVADIARTTISGNKASTRGAGVDLVGLGPGDRFSLSRSTISGNQGGADSVGGGLALTGAVLGAFDVSDSTVSGNVAKTGGGIAFGEPGNPLLDLAESLGIDNSTVASNTATGQGGGVYLSGGKAGFVSSAETRVSGLMAARAARASGTDPGPDVLLTSSVVAGNTGEGAAQDIARATDDPDTGPAAGVFDLSFSLVQKPGDTPVTQTPDGSNLIGADPLLGALENNGGPTQTHLPATTSPVVDSGDAPSRQLLDQRGKPRTIDGGGPRAEGGDGTDMGSVELDRPKPQSGTAGASVTADAAPTVSFTAPAAGAVLPTTAPTTLAATASDDRSVTRVEFRDENRVLCEDTTAPYTCEFRPTSADVGRKTFRAVAVDDAGQSATALRTVAVRRFSLKRITIATTPGRDATSPYTFATTGRLLLPAGVTRADGCNGRVSIQFKAGKKTISTRRVKVTAACTYTSVVSFRVPKRLNPRTLNVRARYSGNAVLYARGSERTTVQVR